MPRPVSWLPRLHVILRSVQNSVLTHYNRRDVELLFKLQPSAASSLMDLLPRVEIGREYMVKREDLERFLTDAREAEDVTALCIRQRAEKENVSRKRPRALVRREFGPPVDPASLSRWVSRGRLEINFGSIQELFDVLWRIACAICGDGLEEFIRLYEPAQPVGAEVEMLRAENKAIQREIEQMEADWVRLQAEKKSA